MIEYLPGLIVAWGVLALGLLVPGPNVLAVIGTAMARGRRAGLSLATGTVAGSLGWSVLSVTGLTALMAAWGEAMTVMKVVGGLYLLWMAWGSIRAALRPPSIAEARAMSGQRLMLRGLTIQATNPKAAAQWVAVTLVGVGGDAPLAVLVAFVAGAVAISAGGHYAYALAFSTTVATTAYGRARRGVELAVGGLFGAAGIGLIASRP